MSPAAAIASAERWIKSGKIPAAEHERLRWVAQHDPGSTNTYAISVATVPTTSPSATSALTSEEKAIARRLGVSEAAMVEQKARAR